jgi:ABC-type transport system substrate-binding protein
VETLVPDESTRIAQLQRGEVDIISSAITPDNLISLKDKGFKLQPIGLPGLLNISFSGTFWTKNPISDINVRRAMSYAINRDEFSKTYFKGLAKPGGFWFWSDLTWAHDVDPTSWEAPKNDLLIYDVNKAKQLLQQAGFPGKFNPQTITLFCEPGPVSDQMQILQGYWQKIGLQVEIKVVDAAVYTGRIFQRAKDPSGDIVGQIWPWGPGGPFPSFFNNVYHSANMFTSKGVHTTSNDPKADELYQAAVHEPDETKSKKMWNDFMHYGYDTMLVNMPVVQYPFNVVAGPKVGDFTQFSYGAIQQAYVGITHGKG